MSNYRNNTWSDPMSLSSENVSKFINTKNIIKCANCNETITDEDKPYCTSLRTCPFCDQHPFKYRIALKPVFLRSGKKGK